MSLKWRPYNMLFENIFSVDQCEQITNKIKLMWSNGLLHKEEPPYYKNSLGSYNLPEALEHLLQVENVVREKYPNIEFENAYTRVYRNGSVLDIHTDRKGLDITLGVCVFSNIQTKWPLSISNLSLVEGNEWNKNIQHTELFKSDKEDFFTPVGTGLLTEGGKYPHWRDSLDCQPDEFAIYTFYHWRLED